MKQRIQYICIFLGILCVLAQVPSIFASDAKIERLYNSKASEIHVKITGSIIALLPDDKRGIRHQQFLIELHSGQTLLVAHNIDLSTKIRALRTGKKIKVSGEYIWSKEGGIIHYTHIDPSTGRRYGWIRYRGRVYQ